MLLIITALTLGKTYSQSKSADLAYLASTHSHQSDKTHSTTKKPLKPLLKYNPAYWFLNGSLTFYQKIISPQLSADCLYEISCSRFSRRVIQEYGLIKGVCLTADRLTRCNRISAVTISRSRVNANGKVVDEPSMYQFNE